MNRILSAAIFSVALLSLNAGLARAEDQSCRARAADKKLAGAAQASFMKKCESDATTVCDAAAADKKLNGAAKASFTKKCVSDAVGS